MGETRYKMDCGCILTENQLIMKNYRSKKSKSSKRHVCKEHHGSIICRLLICEDCGVEFEQTKSGKVSKYCPACRYENQKASMRKLNKKKRAKKKKEKNFDHIKFFESRCNGFNFIARELREWLHEETV